jgi:hypothetical protein
MRHIGSRRQLFEEIERERHSRACDPSRDRLRPHLSKGLML